MLRYSACPDLAACCAHGGPGGPADGRGAQADPPLRHAAHVAHASRWFKPVNSYKGLERQRHSSQIAPLGFGIVTQGVVVAKIVLVAGISMFIRAVLLP